ncbi:hypothetical protein SDC9_46271 [bioreactor metagenome]|uniref:Uncharacterized protein n=1 Tax=bioreactor metagenome TaxID=1076179 RepID=A0A644W958_9ZZZZ
MKYRFRIFILSIFGFINISGQTDLPLSHTIDSMAARDQQSRHLLVLIENGETDSVSIDEALHLIQITDSLNFPLLKSIFEIHGYPGYDKVGKNSSHNFWLLVQHADKYPEFQQQVLDSMQVEVSAGNAYGADYAYLVDRVKINTGQLQIYGTQMILNNDSTSYIPRPVIDPDKLDERRHSVGLPPMDFYINAMNENYFGTLKKE